MKSRFPPCPLRSGSPVWVYIRDSGGGAQDTRSQKAYVLAYIKHHNLILDEMFIDAAVSGGSVAGRHEFERMISLARSTESPIVSGILLWDFKRFARNKEDSQFYKADLRRRGYAVISLSDDIPEGDLSVIYEALLEWKAEQDRKDISKDVKRGQAFTIGLKDESGKYLGLFPGRPPTFFKGVKYDTGLKRNNGQPRIVQRIIPDPETWELGKIAVEMRANGASHRQIESRIKLFPKSPDPSGMYTAIFRNEIYVGTLHYGGQIYYDFVPPLATEDQWEAIKAQRQERPQRGQSWQDKHPRTGKGHFLLVGLCKCGICGASMHGGASRRKGRNAVWAHYRCATRDRSRCHNKRAGARKIEKVVIDSIMGQVLTPSFTEIIVDHVNKSLNNRTDLKFKIQRLDEEVNRLNQMISNLLDLAEIQPDPDILDRLSQRKKERNNALSERSHLNNRLDMETIEVDPRLIEKLLTSLANDLISLNADAQKVVLNHTLEKVEVSPNEAKLYCKFPIGLLGEGMYAMSP
ncbi:MAG: recombinase family protein [Chloroflexota bacterium]